MILLLAAALAAAEPTPAPAPAPHAGWQIRPASLILLGPDGEPIDEAGLGEFRQELDGGMILKTTLLGGISADGRFAWKWRKLETLRPGREDARVGSSASLSYLGPDGKILWQNDDADAPPGAAPLCQSADGETVLLSARSPAGWRVSARGSAGKTLAELSAGQRLERIRLTANGRFALVLWGERDKPLSYALLDLKRGTRKDIPAASVPLGIDRLEEDGAAYSRKAEVYRFP